MSKNILFFLRKPRSSSVMIAFLSHFIRCNLPFYNFVFATMYVLVYTYEHKSLAALLVRPQNILLDTLHDSDRSS